MIIEQAADIPSEAKNLLKDMSFEIIYKYILLKTHIFS